MHRLQFPVQFAEFQRLFGLEAQRFDLLPHFAFDVIDTQQVVRRFVEPACGIVLTDAVPRDGGRFLEDAAAVFRTAVEDFIDAVLADDEHGALAHARVGQQFLDIFQAARFFIDGVLAVPGTEQLARNRHFVKVQCQRPVRVVEGERDFRHPQGTAFAGPVEDDVFHLAAAQVLDALFAQDPAHGIGNIAFSGSVRADDGRNACPEFEVRAVRKGLEA